MHFTCLSFTAADTLIEISSGDLANAQMRKNESVKGIMGAQK